VDDGQPLADRPRQRVARIARCPRCGRDHGEVPVAVGYRDERRERRWWAVCPRTGLSIWLREGDLGGGP
jgi:hypothetical protein